MTWPYERPVCLPPTCLSTLVAVSGRGQRADAADGGRVDCCAADAAAVHAVAQMNAAPGRMARARCSTGLRSSIGFVTSGSRSCASLLASLGDLPFSHAVPHHAYIFLTPHRCGTALPLALLPGALLLYTVFWRSIEPGQNSAGMLPSLLYQNLRNTWAGIFLHYYRCPTRRCCRAASASLCCLPPFPLYLF